MTDQPINLDDPEQQPGPEEVDDYAGDTAEEVVDDEEEFVGPDGESLADMVWQDRPDDADYGRHIKVVPLDDNEGRAAAEKQVKGYLRGED